MNKKILALIMVAFVISGCTIKSINQTTPTGIKESNLANKDRLNLSNQKLNKIPENIFNQTSLIELNISNNELTGSIQAEIRKLENLEILNASNNKMTGVPAEIGQLRNLQVLDLSNNQLTGLPNELGNLRNLRTLNISGNNYSEYDLNGIIKNLPSDTNIIK